MVVPQRSRLPVVFEFVDLEVSLEGVELAGHPGETGINFSAEGFLRFIDPAVRIDQHGKRHNHSEGQRHHLGVGHLKTSLPRFLWGRRRPLWKSTVC